MLLLAQRPHPALPLESDDKAGLTSPAVSGRVQPLIAPCVGVDRRRTGLGFPPVGRMRDCDYAIIVAAY